MNLRLRKPSSSANASAYAEATADKTEDKKEKASTADEVKITVDKAKSNVMKVEPQQPAVGGL